MRRILGFFLAILASFLWTSTSWASISVAPDVVGIGLDYSGATVTVTGKVPAGSQVYLRVTSPPVRVPLNRQGKVAGFWMSVQKTVVEGVPKLYQVYTSDKLTELPPSMQKEIEGYHDALSRAKVVEVQGEKHRLLSPAEATPFTAALASLYEKKGLFAVREKSISVRNGEFTAHLSVPVGIPQGKIQVAVFAVKDGRVVSTQEGSFTVQSKDLVYWLRILSGTNGPVYGGLAVMIALFAGVTVGMVFSWIDRLLGKGATGGMETHAH